MKLNQITIPVLDVRIAIDFYTRLGLQLIVHTHDGYARFHCIDGGTTLSVHKVDKMPFGDRTILYFEKENMDDFVHELIEKGISFEHLPKDQSWLWREARLKDPFGNPIIIYYAGVNRVDPPWKFK